MKKQYAFIALTLAASLLTTTATYADDLVGDVSHGQEVFDHVCRICHARTSSKIGPTLGAIYGRKVGSEPGFAYSAPLKEGTLIWNDETLNQWLSGPQKLFPGQHMNYTVTEPQKRADLIAYLKTLQNTTEK